MVIFNSYVKLPEGILFFNMICINGDRLSSHLGTDSATIDGEAVDVRALAGHLAIDALGGGGRMWTAYTPLTDHLGMGQNSWWMDVHPPKAMV